MKRNDLIKNISPPEYSGNSCFFDSAFMALFGTPDNWINKNIIFKKINNDFLSKYDNTLHTRCYNGDILYKTLYYKNVKNINTIEFKQLCIHYLKEITYLKKKLNREVLFKYIRENYLPPINKRTEWIHKFRKIDREAEKIIKSKIQESLLNMILSMRMGNGGEILKPFKQTIIKNGCLPINNNELKQTFLTNHEQTSITMIRYIFDLFYITPIKFYERKIYSNNLESEDFEIVKNISLSYPIILIDVHEEFDTNNKSKFEELQKLEELDESSEYEESENESENDDKSNESDNKSNQSDDKSNKSSKISENYINKDTNKLSNIIKLGKKETYESETPIYECNDKKYKILQKITKIIDTEFLIVELNRCYFPTYATKRLSYAEIIPEETIILGRTLYLKSIVCYFGNIGDREVPISIEDGGHYVTFLRGFDNGKCKWYFYNDISVINGKVEFKEIGDFDNLVKNDIVRKKSVVYIYTTDNGKTNVCPEHIQDIINMGINL